MPEKLDADSEQESSSITEPVDEWPDGGYGWVIAVCASLMNAATYGVNTSYGVYTSFFLENNYYSGGSPMRYAFVGGFSVASSMLVAPISNYLMRRFGIRLPLMLATLFFALGQFMSGLAKNYPEYFITQGLLFGIGMGLSFTTLVSAVSQWFNRRLGIAQGISLAGSGVGGLLYSNITRLAIEKWGMRDAYFLNGSISLFIMIVCTALMRDRKNAPVAKYAMFSPKFVFHRGFFWIWSSGVLSMMAWFVALFSMASYATEALGISQAKAAALQSILAAGQMTARPLLGYNLDRLGPVNITMTCHFITGIGCIALWYPARCFGILVPFAYMVGALGGNQWFCPPSLTATVLDYKDCASALSVYWLAMAFAAQFGQPIAVALNNYSAESLHRTGPHKYQISIGFCAGLYLAASFLVLGVRFHLLGRTKGLKFARV